MKTVLLATAALLAPLIAHAQNHWIRVAETDASIWEVKPGSLEMTQTKGKVDIVVVVGRKVGTATRLVSVGKWYVSLADCGRQMGKLVTLDLDGAFRFENDFVFGDGTVSASLGQAICAAHSHQLDAREQKGI